jgi:Uma2 family endonuclease
MASAPKPLDYAAYLRTPEIRRRYDIVDGVIHFMSPSPNLDHQRAQREILVLLDRHVKRYHLGEVVGAPLDIIISKGPLRTRQPDVMFISNERRDVARVVVEGGPDLVVEILSPGNGPRDVREKLRDYASIDVLEAWIADPRKKTIAVLHPAGGEFQETAVYRAAQILRSKVLPRLRLPVARAFPA